MSELAPGALRLVCITPGDRAPAAIQNLVQAALSGGVTAVLLRERALDPEARLRLGLELAALCRQVGAALLVSNDVTLAQACGAAGVQLGHGGPNVAAVRRAAPELSIGRSAHWPLGDEDRAADYVTLSPVALTMRSWPRPLLSTAQLQQAIEDPQLGPVVALGGLDTQSVAQLPAGLAGVAVIRALSDAAKPAEAARSLRSGFDDRLAAGAGRPT
jgi:thiamine-phosphate pyrophosphorylase